ncbi:MAG: transcription-repair coupling factor, partial [Gammaproteobacteria bacterium]|nr:transcription-repair coupling factor [Gammaproteobacteria bacterium]
MPHTEIISSTDLCSPLNPELPAKPGKVSYWGHLYGNSIGLVISSAAQQHDGPVVIITGDTAEAQRLDYAIRFFMRDNPIAILDFPDRETLPYDQFSPHQDIISDRLTTLYQLRELKKSILIVPVQTLMHRLPPQSFLDSHCLLLKTGQQLDLEQMRQRLESSGYNCVSSVIEHGEFAVRGSLLDLFPMGSKQPYRIELFDDDIESIRSFDPETQRSDQQVEEVQLLPAREFPMNKDGISHFRQSYRARFEGNPQNNPLYRDISNGLAAPGIEYYLPLFFDQTATLFDYLPASTLFFNIEGIKEIASQFWSEIGERYEELRHDIERPLLPPNDVFIPTEEIFSHFKSWPRVNLQTFKLTDRSDSALATEFATAPPPSLNFNIRTAEPAAELKKFLSEFKGRILFAAETTGRREHLLDMLRSYEIFPTTYGSWNAFLHDTASIGITVAPLDQGLLLDKPKLAVIAESQLFGTKVLQRRRRKRSERDADSIIRNLAELTVNAPVVHEEYGVGRYLGLQTLKIGNLETEFLTMVYADGDKLYVPVSSLHLISRYTGADAEHAPLHKLGSGQWERARRKASEKV